jgi:hypothetical protein
MPPIIIIVNGLRAREKEQRADIVIVSGFQCRNIPPARIADSLHFSASPRESLAAEAHDQQIGHQPCMPAIPVRERMNMYKAMMEAHRDLIRRIGLVFNPRFRLVKQLT